LIRAAETTPKRKLLLKKLSKNNFHHLLFTFFSKHKYNIIIQKEIRCKSKNIKSFKKKLKIFEQRVDPSSNYPPFILYYKIARHPTTYLFDFSPHQYFFLSLEGNFSAFSSFL